MGPGLFPLAPYRALAAPDDDRGLAAPARGAGYPLTVTVRLPVRETGDVQFVRLRAAEQTCLGRLLFLQDAHRFAGARAP